MGTIEDIQVRIEAKMTDFFFNQTQHGFAETRIISRKLTLSFLGGQPMTFKPGMPMEGQVSVLFNGYMPLEKEILKEASLTLKFEDQSGIVFKEIGNSFFFFCNFYYPEISGNLRMQISSFIFNTKSSIKYG